MPGYAKDYKGYAFDQNKAKALLAEAGFPDGFDTEILANNTDPNPRIVQAIQQDLAAVGIRAAVKTLAQANVIAAGGEKEGAAMIWSGGMAWIADFPDPSNFYGPILGCAGAVQGGWNWSWYCKPELDKRAAEADSIVDPAKMGERDAAWGAIYTDVMKDAPWAPVFNEQRYTMKSARMRGDDKLFVELPFHPSDPATGGTGRPNDLDRVVAFVVRRSTQLGVPVHLGKMDDARHCCCLLFAAAALALLQRAALLRREVLRPVPRLRGRRTEPARNAPAIP